MRKLILAALMLLGAAIPSSAAITDCVLTAGALKLEKPVVGITPFSTFAACLVRDLDILSSSVAFNSTFSSSTFHTLYVSTIGGNPLSSGVVFSSSVYFSTDLQVGSTFFINGGRVGIFTSAPSYELHVVGDQFVEGQVIVGSSLTVYGEIFSGSTITATSFIGDGSGLTGVATASDLIRSTATFIGNTITTSVEWESVAGSTMILFMEGSNFVDIELSCNLMCTNNTSCGVAYSFLVDGEFIGPHTAATDSGIQFVKTDGMNFSSPEPILFQHKTTTKLSIGSNTITMLWASIGGVEVQMSTNIAGCLIRYSEAPEQVGTGGITVEAGITKLGAQPQLSLQALVCDVLPCQAQGTFGLFDLWVATGTGPGQWMNTRTGTGPF